jgi:hypothetical protein
MQRDVRRQRDVRTLRTIRSIRMARGRREGCCENCHRRKPVNAARMDSDPRMLNAESYSTDVTFEETMVPSPGHRWSGHRF